MLVRYNLKTSTLEGTVRLIDQILAAQQRDHNTATTVLAREISKPVNKFYSLTPAEIAIVEDASK